MADPRKALRVNAGPLPTRGLAPAASLPTSDAWGSQLGKHQPCREAPPHSVKPAHQCWGHPQASCLPWAPQEMDRVSVHFPRTAHVPALAPTAMPTAGEG